MTSRHLPLLVAAFLTVLSTTSHGETVTGRVVSISDGDTLTLLDEQNGQHKIRLSGIDSPERRQPYGDQARRSLASLAFQQIATANCTTRDRYLREICTVKVGGQDIGLLQISRGLAWWYRQYAREQSPAARDTYERAESQARTQRLGLWGSDTPTPPWEWRKEVRSRQQ